MRTEQPVAIRLDDYRPPAFLVDEVDLTFVLEPSSTRVRSKLSLRRNGDHAEPLQLDGVRLKPVGIAIDGRALDPAEYEITDEHLTIHKAPDAFVLETEVGIDPA